MATISERPGQQAAQVNGAQGRATLLSSRASHRAQRLWIGATRRRLRCSRSRSRRSC